jgi:PKD repeat protein
MDKRLLILIGVSLLSSAGFFTYRKLLYKPDGISYSIKPRDVINAGDSIAYSDQTPGASRWKWDFGDGEFSADQSGHHTYLASGRFPVKLTVYGPFGVLKDEKNIVTVASEDIISVPRDTIATTPVVAIKEEPKPVVAKPVTTAATAPIQMPPQQRPAQVAKPKPAHHEGPKQKGHVLEDLGDGEEIKK